MHFLQQISLDTCNVKGVNHGFYTEFLLAEAVESCLSPRPRVQVLAPEDSSNVNAMEKP